MSEFDMSKSQIIKALNREIERLNEIISVEKNNEMKQYFFGKKHGIEITIDFLVFGKKCYKKAHTN
jgi:predicted transcriptional regulator